MTVRVVILEDEPPAAAQLQQAVARWDATARVVGVAESVRQAVHLLRSIPEPDVIIADIRLSDGLSFRVFDQVALTCPVIFATAYDQHIIAAMERNAIDYLLKPIDPARVGQALDKYLRLRQHFGGRLLELARTLADGAAGTGAASAAASAPPERVLARKGASIVAVPVGEIAWFTTEHKLTLLVPQQGARLLVDESLGALAQRLDQRRFFRLNRQMLANIDAIAAFRPAGKGRLAVSLRPASDEDVIVSQLLADAFRTWLAR